MIKSIGIQYLSKIITFPLSIIVYSLIVKKLSVEEFKDYNLFLGVVIYIVGFIDLGISNFFYRESITKKQYYFFNILLNLKIFMYFLIIIGYILFFNIFNFETNLFIFVYVFLSVKKDILEKFLRSKSKFNYIAYANIISVIFQLFFIILLYIFNKLFFENILIVLILNLLFYIFINYFFFKKINKNFNLKISLKYFIYSLIYVKKHFIYIFPWIIIFLSNLIFSRLDIFMLNYFHLSYGVAEYSSSYNLYEKMEFFLLTISMVFYNYFANNKDLKTFSKILEIITLISLFFVIIVLLFSNIIIDVIIGSKYIRAKELFILMILGTYFKFHTTFFVNWLYLYKKEKIVTIGIFLTLLINYILNYIFIPYYGDMGAAYTTLISDVFNFLIFLFFMYKNNFNFTTKLYIFFNTSYIIFVIIAILTKYYYIFIFLLVIALLAIIKNLKSYLFLKGIL